MATAPVQHPAGPGEGLGVAVPPRTGGGAPAGTARSRLSNHHIAVLVLLGAETMLFTGLVGAYLILRFGSAAPWPPPDQPRLPLPVTAINSGVLLASAFTMLLALRALRSRAQEALERHVNALGVTGFLGSVFLAVQGSEWVRLLRHGLTLQSSNYAATFYLLIGLHGLHVLAGLVWLLVVYARARRGAEKAMLVHRAELCSLYWYFVCGLWAFLFPLVYVP